MFSLAKSAALLVDKFSTTRLSFVLVSIILFFNSSAYPQAPSFDSDRAYSLLRAQCAFGPRNPGSEGHTMCGKWLSEQLKSKGGEIILQTFIGYDPHAGQKRQLTNIVARFGDQEKQPLMLCAHWDSRPVADRDPDPLKTNQPIPGANDGASGVAVLLEIARVVSENPPDKAILIVLFDGEDLGRETHPEEYAQGARYWALHPVPELPSEAILLDMVGDADLELPIEWYSGKRAPTLQRALWEIASEIGATTFVDRQGPAIEDDHVPLLKAGISSVDIIDFDYPYWHTLDDTPDKCSAASLGQVGKVLIEYIYR